MRYARWVAIAAGLALMLASRHSNAQDLPRHVFAVSPDEEIQDLLVLSDSRPALIRLHIRVDGEGHRGRWREFVGRLHVEADVNRDGVVNRTEANQALDRVYRLQTTNLIVAQVPRRQNLYLPQVVTVDDLVDQMRTVAREFEIQRQAPPPPSSDDATFRLLDRDRDGYLSREELAAAASSLGRLDLDDDETITAEELGPYRNPFFNNVAVARTPTGPNANPAEIGTVVSASEQRPWDLARQIIRRYDGRLVSPTSARPSTPSRDGTIQAGELSIDQEAFARLDSNSDGSINAAELERAVTDATDLELIVRLGRREPGQAPIERLEGNRRRPPFGAPALRRVGDLVLIELESTLIELRTEPDGTDPLGSTRALFEARFRTADLDGNGYLDRTEIQRFAIPADICDEADRDDDGMLTIAEWRAHLDRQAAAIGLRTVLQTSEQGPSFLDLLDENRDRRLGRRELQGAARRILLEDRDGDGRVSLREFGRRHRWTIARNQAPVASQPPILVDQRFVGPGNSVAAPEWFLKMDRNRDGDVSPREFLGTRSSFEGYDADRDGLISAQEANQRP
jgi:Ca2+-binding EF-hand superfamily protein